MKLFGIFKSDNFKVETVNSAYECKNVILATGKSRSKPKIKGLEEYEGKGISYCAICDAFFYKDKHVGIIGEGNYAISEAKYLLPVAKSVILLTDGKKAIENRDIDIKVNTKKVKEFKGNLRLEEIEFEDNTNLKLDGVFIAKGIASSTDLAKKTGAYVINNNIKIDENMNTSVLGLYACGDCTGGVMQISKAIYEGTKTALDIINNIKK